MGGAVAYCTYNRNPRVFRGVIFVCPMCKIGEDFLPPQWVIDLFRRLAGPKGTASTLGYLPIAPSQGIDIDLSVRPIKQAMLTAFPVDYARRPRLATARELLDVTIHMCNTEVLIELLIPSYPSVFMKKPSQATRHCACMMECSIHYFVVNSTRIST